MAMTQSNMTADAGDDRAQRGGMAPAGVSVAGGGSLSCTWAIAQRELAALFFSPIAYIVGAIFLGVTAWYFMSETLVAGQEASMRPLMERMAALLVFALPLLTMRAISDDYANGTIETLMTAPVTDMAVVVGKFLGAFLFYIVLLAATLLHVVLLAGVTSPVGSVVAVSYLGMLLLGGLFISVGIFASSCTRHQLVAAVLAMVILGFFSFVVDAGAEYAGSATLRTLCANLNVFWAFADFAKGIIDTKSVIFFCSGIVFFLFLATKVMESRRWR